MDDDILAPPPGHTARLDQLGARARDLPAEVRARLDAAAERARDAPGPETVAALWEELRAAGLGE
ncbi:hypothetical protein ACFVYP_07120 [Kitasatospora sp. NPDC058201]|uniref:hypothetical protein n=1 Tax=unclassified Kitasatospora TaxID=2633591 RepID=UPI003668BEF5